MAENVENVEVKETGKKKASKKKVILIVVIVLAVLIVGGIAIGKFVSSMTAGMEEAMEMMAGGSETLYEVEKTDVKQEITTSGTVIGLEKTAYTSPVTAKVEDVKVEVGQIVKKGDILLTYDTTDLGDNLAKVQLQAQSERAAGNAAYEAVNEASSKVSEAKAEIKELKSEIKELNKEIKELTKTISAYEAKIKAANAGKTEEEYDSTAGLTAKELKKYNKALSDL